LHRIRLTEDKITDRLELVETLVYRRRQPLPPTSTLAMNPQLPLT